MMPHIMAEKQLAYGMKKLRYLSPYVMYNVTKILDRKTKEMQRRSIVKQLK